MIAIAATSAFAERTFSLARRLKSYLRSQMKDDTFFNLGVIAWYDDEELENIIDFVSVGNKFIHASSANRKNILEQNSQVMTFYQNNLIYKFKQKIYSKCSFSSNFCLRRRQRCDLPFETTAGLAAQTRWT